MTRKLAITELPGWPRGLTQEQAAAYMGVSVATYNRAVKAKKYPGPTLEGGRYDKHLLDQVGKPGAESTVAGGVGLVISLDEEFGLGQDRGQVSH